MAKKKTQRKVGDSIKATDVVAWLSKAGTKKTKSEMLARYGIPNEKAFGMPMGQMKSYAKEIGNDHQLAVELWKTGFYEARTVAAFVDDPEKVTSRQMDHWVNEFDSWAICDTVCFHLFDKTRFAWSKVPKWISSDKEFVRRAGFAMVWALSVHDKVADNSTFFDALKLIEECPSDGRLLVKKGSNMALRAVGKRNKKLNAAAIQTAKLMSKMEDKPRSWIGSHALRELESKSVQARLGK